MNIDLDSNRLEIRQYPFRLKLPLDVSTRGSFLRELMRIGNDGTQPPVLELQMKAARAFLGPLNTPAGLSAIVDKVFWAGERIPPGVQPVLNHAAAELLREVNWINTPELAEALAQEHILNGASEGVAVPPADRHNFETTELAVLTDIGELNEMFPVNRVESGESCDVLCNELGIPDGSPARLVLECLSAQGPATVRVLSGEWYGEVCRDLGIGGWPATNHLAQVQQHRDVLLRIRNGESLDTVLTPSEATTAVERGLSRLFMERIAVNTAAVERARSESVDAICESLGIREPVARALLEHREIEEVAAGRVMAGERCVDVCHVLGIKGVLAQTKLETIALNSLGRDRVTNGESPEEVCRVLGIRRLAAHWALEMTAPGGRVLR